MIPIQVCIARSFGNNHEGARLSRYADEDTDNKLEETTENFKKRKKARKSRINRKKKQSVFNTQRVDPDGNNIRVNNSNWLGRLEREPSPKKSRIRIRRHTD